MKLQTKLTLLSLIITLTVLGIGLAAFHIYQETALLEADRLNAQHSLQFFCSNVLSAANTDQVHIQQLTLRSMITYYFSSYARLMKASGSSYALYQNDRYLFSNCAVDTLSLLREDGLLEVPSLSLVIDGQSEIPLIRFSEKEGSYLIGACSFTLSDQVYIASICLDVSSTASRIVHMRLFSTGILLAAFLCVVVFMTVLLRPILQPINQLTKTATQIANGKYDQRTRVMTQDEIGQLSEAFDRMAHSIEDKIKTLNEQLNKKQLLLTALTHELKTPLTAMIGFSDSLLHMPLSEEQRLICAQKIYAAGKHTEALVNKLMDLIFLSDLEQEESSIQMKKFPARHLADRICKIVPATVQLTCAPIDLYGDETLLFSLIMNLVDNAAKASPEGAPVDVLISGNDRMAYITVSDRGRGIAPEYLSLVTEPFFRVDKARSRKDGGTGLGLALCKMIAELHGGCIEIKSELDKGTCVTVTLLQLDDNSKTT